MGAFINGTGVISAQHSFDESVFEKGFITFEGNRWACQEPDYNQFIDGKQIRRMSRIIRMGIVSSILATRKARVEKPDAVIVGTAFGCLEDTYSFLSKLVQYKEDMLSPTAFIHSTHNTIASQIALLFQCHGYNSTYVHRALSFESALTDALMLIEENTASDVLVGGIDEITNASFTIMDRMGFYRASSLNTDNFYSGENKGSVAGEGSAFFSVSNTRKPGSIAEIAGVDIMSFTNKEEVVKKANQLLQQHELSIPDLFISGHNGDKLNDNINDYVAGELQCKSRTLKYKHWCGEFTTATGFATWMGSQILKNKQFPSWIPGPFAPGTPVKSLLIYNQQEGSHHSLLLLRSC